VTLLCGFGHVTVSVVLGVLALLLGREMLEAFGARLESVAGILLIGFGLAYGLWGLRHAVADRLHGHSHAHFDHVHDPSKASVLGLFLLFSADPCVRLIPIMIAAAPVMMRRRADAVGDGGAVVVRLAEAFLDAAQQEHVVVHR